MLKRILLGIAGVLLLVIVAGATLVQLRWKRTFDVPLPTLQASTDSGVIARGRYLVYGPARCIECHVNRAEAESVRTGATPALAGGFEFPTPVGTFITPNITPHPTLGIGRLTDGQIARALRSGVRHDGRVLIPFMEFENLSDADIQAVISFLRSQPPVAREVPEHRINLAGKMVLAYMMKPPAPSGAPATSPAESATVERGRYLAEAVATCASCHSKRSDTDGSYIGPRYAGGNRFEDLSVGDEVFVSPNLTPATAGRITGWTEDQFVERFRMGPILPHTPMPWSAFKRMSETDVRAIYRYLKTLPAVENDPGPSIQKKAD